MEEGNKVAFQAFGVGVQIYRWNGTSWNFVAPEAVLFARGDGVVATHFAGPTWESNSGSTVVGAVIDSCTPDPDAIPWLLLEAAETDGARHLRRGDLHPAGEHRGRQRPRRARRRSSAR